MSGVVKKKKKSLFARIIDRLLRGSTLSKQDNIVYHDTLYDVRISNDEQTTIISRRAEMSSQEYDVSDATVTFQK